MTMNSSGPISLSGSTAGESIAVELGISPTAEISLTNDRVRALAQVATGAIIMPTSFYGKSTIRYLTLVTVTGTGTSKTYNNVNIGVPCSTRRVYILVANTMQTAGNNTVLTGAGNSTIGGVPVTVLGPTYGSGTNLGVCLTVITALVPTGTTATVFLRFAKSNNIGGAAIYVFSVINQTSATNIDAQSTTRTSSGTSVFSNTVTTVNGGFCIGAYIRSTNDSTSTLSGLLPTRGPVNGFSNVGFTTATNTAGSLTATWTLPDANPTTTSGLWSFAA
jgi:hypothetical protein